MKTLVHHHGALGDVLLSLPCLRLLRRPEGSIHFAGRRDIGLLLREAGIAEESSDSGSSRYAGLSAGLPGREMTSFLEQFDRAVLFTGDAENPVRSALGRSIAQTKIVITVPPPGAATSAARYRLSQLDPEAHLEERLLLSPSHRDLAAAMLSRWGWKGDRPLVMVHPGSGGRNKRWPLERFFSLARTLMKQSGTFIVVFTGPAEDDLFLDRVEKFCQSQEVTVHAGDADLTALAALLSYCGAYVGNDSGVSHLAAAAGAPTIALFGPTDPLVWGPVGRQAKVISAASLDAISVEQVAEAVEEFLSGAAGEENNSRA